MAKRRVASTTVSRLKHKHEHAVNRTSHHERVAMRQMLRDSGVISKDADNQKADAWLDSHGYLYHAGYKPPEDRVQKLAQQIGRRRKRG